uniref:LTD domain-containing protein n=1 Tax=Plectus sambesii TaxID=2011161 RepID=A0A914WF80_9BILA
MIVALDVIAVSLTLLVIITLLHLLLKLTVWAYSPSKGGSLSPSPLHHVTVRSVDCATREESSIASDQQSTVEEFSEPCRQGSRYTYERVTNGKIKITTCDPLGRFIAVQNTSRLHSIDIGEWQLCRKINQSVEIVFIFPHSHVLRALEVCRVYTRDSKEDMAENDLLCERNSWDSGHTIETSLIRPDGMTMAMFLETSESSVRVDAPLDSTTID